MPKGIGYGKKTTYKKPPVKKVAKKTTYKKPVKTASGAKRTIKTLNRIAKKKYGKA